MLGLTSNPAFQALEKCTGSGLAELRISISDFLPLKLLALIARTLPVLERFKLRHLDANDATESTLHRSAVRLSRWSNFRLSRIDCVCKESYASASSVFLHLLELNLDWPLTYVDDLYHTYILKVTSLGPWGRSGHVFHPSRPQRTFLTFYRIFPIIHKAGILYAVESISY